MRILCRTPLFFLAKRYKSFITTPIFYANGEPHIGHLYSAVIADTGHRWNLLKSGNLSPKKTHDQFLFTTGTDEHGIKIQTAAEMCRQEPIQFCDRISNRFHQLFQEFDVAHTDFIRTSEERHKLAVEAVWNSLADKGLIYKDVYSGWYSITDECFYSEADIEPLKVNGKEGMVAKATKNEVELVGETNYMFRLGQFSEEIRKWLITSDVIRPKDYLPAVLQCIRKDEDLSISRDSKRLKWGIPVPGDASQTIYVWLDALVNYLTVAGYPDMDKVKTNWPPTFQVIGKDILKFHAVYWPAMLMALELPLPEKLFVHAHWLVEGKKMSKSIGNVVDPFQSSQALTVEGLKYFLLKQGVPHADGNFTVTKAVNMINADLVNNLGNLLNRAVVDKLNPKQRYPYFDIEVMERDLSSTGTVLIEELNSLRDKCAEAYDHMMIYRALEAITAVARNANAFYQLHAPWKLPQEPKLNTVLYIIYETSRITSILLQPVVPEYAKRALDRLGVAPDARGFDKAIFGGGPDYGSNLGEDKGPLLKRVKLGKEPNKADEE
ncbi:hypothetical protein QR680_018118 [Steinernema hermaphroditum]|uniref:Methionine--tRNA ligase, mitochondrial n=1 Tax=Steinernema hermaphroditum TaxID=289476 RepID=A0AA39HJ11_9BILA|nr:hypothetical protein QR680_018118 [Steinernema hermaphroditum]